MTKPKKTKKLLISKKKELEEWQEKVENDNTAMEEAKKFSLRVVAPFDPFLILPKFAREVIPKIIIKGEKLSKEDTKLMEQVAWTQAVESGIVYARSCRRKIQGHAT